MPASAWWRPCPWPQRGYKASSPRPWRRRKPGAEALLSTVEQGKASARLLQDRAVRTWLEQSHVDKLNERLETLTSGLAPVDEAMQALLEPQA